MPWRTHLPSLVKRIEQPGCPKQQPGCFFDVQRDDEHATPALPLILAKGSRCSPVTQTSNGVGNSCNLWTVVLQNDRLALRSTRNIAGVIDGVQLMSKFIFSGAVLAFMMSGAAHAADAVSSFAASPPEASQPSSFSFAGGYAGIQGGYGWGESFVTTGVDSGTIDFDGGRFGAFAGYNWGMGSSVIAGVEADLAYDWNDQADGVDTLGTNLQGGLRARLGYAADRALFYAAGGWTATQFTYEEPGVSNDQTMNGWTLGAGIDYAVTDRVFARGEYRYNDYGSETIDGVEFDFKQHVVQVGLGVKF